MPIRRPTPVPVPSKLRRHMQKRRVKEQQQSQVSLARFGAITALIGATLGAVGAGIPALIASNNQIYAEEIRSSIEFRRDQRQNAYAAFVEAHEALVESQAYRTSDLLSRSYEPNSEPPEEDLSIYHNYGVAWSVVRLVGSEPAVQQAANLLSKRGEIGSQQAILQFILDEQGLDDSQWPTDVQDMWIRASDQLDQLQGPSNSDGSSLPADELSPFVEQARIDLGTR